MNEDPWAQDAHGRRLAVDVLLLDRETRVVDGPEGAPARIPSPIRARSALPSGPSTPATIAPMEIMGIRIPTVVQDNVARRCDCCLQVIDGTPWRINLLDSVATEVAAPWTDTLAINPGPFEFHSDEVCVRGWLAKRAFLFCRKGRVREIMRPVPIPNAAGSSVRWGVCDGIHRDDHEFVPA